MRSYQASQRRNLDQQTACFFKIEVEQIAQNHRREQFENEKKIKIEKNVKRLKEYIVELRRTYDGDTLNYLEENVFKAWERHHYRRTAELAHYDVEKAIVAMNLKKYMSEIRRTYKGEILAYIEENVLKKWEINNYCRPLDLAHEDVEKAIEILAKSGI